MAYHREEDASQRLTQWVLWYERGQIAQVFLAPRDAMPDAGIRATPNGQMAWMTDQALRAMQRDLVVMLLTYHRAGRPSWWRGAFTATKCSRRTRARWIGDAHHEFAARYSEVAAMASATARAWEATAVCAAD